MMPHFDVQTSILGSLLLTTDKLQLVLILFCNARGGGGHFCYRYSTCIVCGMHYHATPFDTMYWTVVRYNYCEQNINFYLYLDDLLSFHFN